MSCWLWPPLVTEAPVFVQVGVPEGLVSSKPCQPTGAGGSVESSCPSQAPLLETRALGRDWELVPSGAYACFTFFSSFFIFLLFFFLFPLWWFAIKD